MQPGQEPPPPRTLSYAPPDPPRRVSWVDLGGHALFGLGVALVLGGFMGRDYRWSGPLGDTLMQYYPHIMMVGGFICGMLISVRLGPFQRG
jgi:hypothetical protein